MPQSFQRKKNCTKLLLSWKPYCWSFSQILARREQGYKRCCFTYIQPTHGKNTIAILCKGKRVYKSFCCKIKFLTSVYLWSCSARPARPLASPLIPVAICRTVFRARSVNFVFEQIVTTVYMQIVLSSLQHIIELNFFKKISLGGFIPLKSSSENSIPPNFLSKTFHTFPNSFP